VYENPQTLFVAGFIGSPAMNFMPGKADTDGSVVLDNGGKVRVSRVRVEAGRAVQVGIRPEHLRPCDPASAFFRGPVEMVEQLGADMLVHIGHGTDALIARLPHGPSPELGVAFAVDADPARVFLFDAASGTRIV